MAGSLSHIVDDETGAFRMDLIENLGDAHEALEECYLLIKSMSGGIKEAVNKHCRDLGFPDIESDMTDSLNDLGNY